MTRGAVRIAAPIWSATATTGPAASAATGARRSAGCSPATQVIDPSGRARPLDLALPGRANRSNAVVALAVADAFGVNIAHALRELRGVTSVAGRLHAGEPARL